MKKEMYFPRKWRHVSCHREILKRKKGNIWDPIKLLYKKIKKSKIYFIPKTKISIWIWQKKKRTQKELDGIQKEDKYRYKLGNLMSPILFLKGFGIEWIFLIRRSNFENPKPLKRQRLFI